MIGAAALAMARRDPAGIRLLTRNGHDWSPRYPLIVEAVNKSEAPP
jgi:ATP-dependent DNA ligase